MRFRRMVEVYLTYDTLLYGNILKELNKKGIFYKTKVINGGIQNRIMGTFIGHMGEKCNIENMYYIYVYQEDVEYAKRVIMECCRE